MTFSCLVLGESLELLIDNRGKNPPYAPTGVPIVSGMSVRPNGLELEGSKFASAATWQQWMPKPTQENDVILTSEAPLGRVALVQDARPLLVAQRVFCLRGKAGVLDSRFLYYSLQTDRVQADLASRATGTTVVGIRQPELLKVKIPAPPFEEQRLIAAALGSLDDKIRANRRATDKTEQLMVAIARSVEALVPVSELAAQSNRACAPEGFDDVVAHFSLPAFDSGSTPEIVERDAIKSNKFLFSKPAVLFSKLNPRIPRIWNVPTLPKRMALSSTEFVVLIPEELDCSELWATLSQPEVSGTLQQKAAGTSGSHQRVRPKEVLDLLVRDVRRLEAEQRESLRDLGAFAQRLRAENQMLAKTRNELLPLLMEGTVTIGARRALSQRSDR